MKFRLRVRVLSLFMMGVGSFQASAQQLTLDQFLTAIQGANPGFKAAQMAVESSKGLQVESELAYSPILYSTIQYSEDGKPSFLPSFSYDKIVNQSYNLGVSKKFTFGLQSNFYYLLSQTTYDGAFPTYAEGRPTLELTQSLWRNGWGKETQAQVAVARASAEAGEYEQSFVRKGVLVQAESAYWRLALARQSFDLAKENLARAEKILQWTKRRVNLSLADKADLLMTTTGWQKRTLDLKIAQNEMRAASSAFNEIRGVIGDSVPEALETISPALIEKIKAPEKMQDREDLLAAQKRLELAKAQSELGVERNKPTLDLFGTYAFNSREDIKSEAVSESLQGKQPTKIIGLKFSTPLSFETMAEAKKSYQSQVKAAELSYQKIKLAQDQDWNQLVLRLNEAKDRYQTAEELEKIQKEKLDYERDRQERGRTTLFQVLNFETDYLDAQKLRLVMLNELLQITSQMKLYGVK